MYAEALFFCMPVIRPEAVSSDFTNSDHVTKSREKLRALRRLSGAAGEHIGYDGGCYYKARSL